MLEFLRPSVRAMTGYTPGEQLNDPDVIKLNTNENPYPPSPRVLEAIQQSLNGNTLRKYPQPLGDRFRQAAAGVLQVDPDSILIGNGSDDILTIITRAFVPESGRILAFTPSYLLYKTLAEIQGATFETRPFQPDWSLPDHNTLPKRSMTFLPNPNSPSGTVVSQQSILQLAERGPLVLDEAYGDFAESNGMQLLSRTPNLIISRTMSKYYALAGIRFGFAVASPSVVHELIKVKDSYNCDALSLAAATAAIQDQSYYDGLLARIRATRGRLTACLVELGFEVTPSQANFIWCRRGSQPLKPIADALKARKILIRYLNYPEYGEGLRITVGTPADVERLISELAKIV